MIMVFMHAPVYTLFKADMKSNLSYLLTGCTFLVLLCIIYQSMLFQREKNMVVFH